MARTLRDRDWRVAVEAVRALAGDTGDNAGRDAVAAATIGQHGPVELQAAVSKLVAQGRLDGVLGLEFASLREILAIVHFLRVEKAAFLIERKP